MSKKALNSDEQQKNILDSIGDDENDSGIDRIWVLFRIHQQLYAIQAKRIREMVELPKVSQLPDMPTFIRGVINLRGHVHAAVDLETLLGLKSAHEGVDSLVELLKAREQDHRKWLAELEASVREKREFKLTFDPHACAFGKWYDSFKTDLLVLKKQLELFDRPHRAIHEMGKKVREVYDSGDAAGALKIIDEAKTGVFLELLSIFETTYKILLEYSREIAVIVESESGRTAAFVVDAVVSVEELQDEQLQAFKEIFNTLGDYHHKAKFIDRVAKRSKHSLGESDEAVQTAINNGEQMVLLLDAEMLLQSVPSTQVKLDTKTS